MIKAYAAAAALAVLAPAAAAQATHEQAEAIRSGFKRWLNEQFQYYGPDFHVAVEGGITVAPRDSGYALTLGAMTVTLDPMTMTWDAIEATLEPLANGRLRAVFQLPPEIRITDSHDPAAATTVTIGRGDGDIVVAPEYRTMLSGTIELGDLSAVVAGGIGQVDVANVVMASTADDLGNGIFDTTGVLKLEGLSIAGPGGASIGLDQLNVDVATEGIDLERYVALGEQLNQLGRSMQGDPAVNTEAVLAEMGRLWTEGGIPLDGFGIDYRLKGLTVDWPGQRIAFVQAGLGFGLDGLTGDTAEASVRLAFAGLAVEPAEAHEMVPSSAELELAVTGLPVQAAVDLANGFFMGESLDAVEPGAPTMFDRFGEAVMQSGLAFEIRKLKVEAAGGAVDASATLRPDMQAAFGAVGTAALAIAGLERITAELGQDPEMGMLLTLLQSSGEAATDAQGHPIRRYGLELTQSGQALLNGTDVAPALQDALE